MIFCVGLDLSLCPESSFGLHSDYPACHGFEEVDRVGARRDVGYDPRGPEPQWLKSIAYRTIAAYAAERAEEREANTPQCATFSTRAPSGWT